MKESEILDTEIVKKKNVFRIGAFLLEFIPALVLVLYVEESGGFSLLVLFLPFICLIYFIFGWYIFKKEKYNTVEIIIAELIGAYFLLCGFSYLAILESFPNGGMLTTAFFLGFPIEVGLLMRYIKNQNDPFEIRFSLKLLSRVIFFHLIITYLFFRMT